MQLLSLLANSHTTTEPFVHCSGTINRHPMKFNQEVSSRLYVDVLGGYVSCSKCPSTLWKDFMTLCLFPRWALFQVQILKHKMSVQSTKQCPFPIANVSFGWHHSCHHALLTHFSCCFSRFPCFGFDKPPAPRLRSQPPERERDAVAVEHYGVAACRPSSVAWKMFAPFTFHGHPPPYNVGHLKTELIVPHSESLIAVRELLLLNNLWFTWQCHKKW